MKHLKSTFVGVLALTAAASDAFAQGLPPPPMGGSLPAPPMGGGLPGLSGRGPVGNVAAGPASRHRPRRLAGVGLWK